MEKLSAQNERQWPKLGLQMPLNHVCLFLSMMENEKIKGIEYFRFFGNAILPSSKEYLIVKLLPCDISS